ncbi:MAG: PhoH family protein [Spirochaetaceae bacterium]|nr:MAG: PhoH family protein [Spirochaetaceae bacterium]
MSEVCGVHDANLKVLEELLQTPIRSRGNELFLDDSAGEKRDVLVRVVTELQDHIHLGQPASPALIRALFASVTGGDAADIEQLKQVAVAIPSSGRSVFPRSHAQAAYLRGMDEYDMTFCVGPAGTGKTYLAVAHALSEVLARKKRKLVLTRPVVEAGERLGFLPGDLSQKINPYLKPLYDAMESLASGETVQRLEENRIIEIAPLAYMRGRSLNDCYIILDEAQNTTREQMKMFLTRMGEGSKVVITGDVTQIDLPNRNQSGLLHAVELLRDIPDISFSWFTARDVVRNPLVRKIIDAYEMGGG